MTHRRMRGLGALARGAELAPWLAVVAMALLALAPALAAEGMVATRAAGDSPFNLQRVHQMALALSDRHLPPRWMPDAAYGMGYPFWNYYAPLAYLWAGLVAALGGGVVGAVKVTQALCFLAAGWGAWRLGRDTWGSRAAGVLVAASYTFAPYHMVNVYARGDALAELAAYATFPWLLVALEGVVARPRPRRVAALAIATALLLLSHNISALLFLPLLAAYGLWRLLGGTGRLVSPASGKAPRGKAPLEVEALRRQWRARAGAGGPPADWVVDLGTMLARLEARLWPLRRWLGRPLAAVAGGLLLGAGLAAWFWMPALGERELVRLAESTSGYFDYRNHFLGWDLLRPGLPYDYDAEAGAPVGMAWPQLVVALLGLVLGWRRGARRAALRFWAVAALATTAMITPLSAPLWSVTPLLPFAQFPWRWLSVQALALALLAGPLAPAAASWLEGRGRRAAGWAAALGLATLLAASAMLGLAPEIVAIAPPTRADVQAFELLSGNVGSTVRAEYLPQSVRPRPFTGVDVVLGREGDPRALSGTLSSATLLRSEAAAQEWQIEVEGLEAAVLVFPTLAFPGWMMALDEQTPVPVEAETGTGWLRVEVPPGAHTLRLWLGRSDVRAFAELLSLVALLLLATLWLAAPLRAGRGWRLPVALALAVGASVLVARVLPTGTSGEDGTGLVSADWPLSPWPHAHPEGLAFGDARLLDLTTSGDEGAVTTGGTLLVSPAWSERPEDHAVEVALVSPALVLFGVPDVVAEAREPLVDGASIALEVPGEAAPGAYFLRLRVLAPEGDPLPVRTARREIASAYFGPLRLKQASEEPVDAPEGTPLLRAPDLALHDLEAEREGDVLALSWTWWPATTPERDLKLSLRLRDPEAESDAPPLVQDDKVPGYGLSPPTLWAPGRPVRGPPLARPAGGPRGRRLHARARAL